MFEYSYIHAIFIFICIDYVHIFQFCCSIVLIVFAKLYVKILSLMCILCDHELIMTISYHFSFNYIIVSNVFIMCYLIIQ